MGLTVLEEWESIIIMPRNRQAGMVLEQQLRTHIQIHSQEAERKRVGWETGDDGRLLKL